MKDGRRSWNNIGNMLFNNLNLENLTSVYNIYIINPTNILANPITFRHERSQKLVGQSANKIYLENNKMSFILP